MLINYMFPLEFAVEFKNSFDVITMKQIKPSVCQIQVKNYIFRLKYRHLIAKLVHVRHLNPQKHVQVLQLNVNFYLKI